MNSDSFISAAVTILTAIVGVAILATLVSSKSQTSQVIKAAGDSFSGILSAALSPIGNAGSSPLTHTISI